VTKLVSDSYHALKKDNPRLPIGAFVFPGTKTLGQNWQDWLNKDLLDYYAVMVLSQTKSDMENSINGFKKYTQPQKKGLIVGMYIAPYLSEEEIGVKFQIQRNSLIDGLFVPSDRLLNADKQQFYDESIFWKKASVPEGL